MEYSYFLTHSLELRLALSVATAVGLFAIVRGAYFLDEKFSALLKQRKAAPAKANHGVLNTACAAAGAR